MNRRPAPSRVRRPSRARSTTSHGRFTGSEREIHTVGSEDGVKTGVGRRRDGGRINHQNRRQAARGFDGNEAWLVWILYRLAARFQPVGATPDGFVSLVRFVVLYEHSLALTGVEQLEIGRSGRLMETRKPAVLPERAGGAAAEQNHGSREQDEAWPLPQFHGPNQPDI